MTLDELITIIRKMNGNYVWIYAGSRHYATVRSIYLERWFSEHKAFMWDVKDVLTIERLNNFIFPDIKVCFDMFD
jgi:hypothetical protein